MPELEIHHESEHAIDPMSQRVGIMAAILAVALAIVSISSHRTHTEAIIHKSTANDKWAQYQSSRVKYHSIELGETLAALVGPKNGGTEELLADYARQKKKYENEGKSIMAEARQADESAEADEHRALRFDFGEGLLEIALVVTSLYFISRKRMFPAMGLIAGILGALVAATGLLI
jgi:Domain of unknown function (DUF4337)